MNGVPQADSRHQRAGEAIVAGVDGARGAWLTALVPLDESAPGTRLELHEDFAGVRECVDRVGALVVAVDMPIGLAEDHPRESDRQARQRLGPRRSSLFPTPSAAVLAASTHREADEANRVACGVGLSIQAWNLVPMIRQVRAAVSPTEIARFVECHPETSFTAMAGEPLPSKKTAAGVGRRLQALRSHIADLDDVLAAAPRRASIDDSLDALAAAWSARRYWRGTSDRLGSGHDSAGYALSIIV